MAEITQKGETITIPTNFTWIPFYMEFADKLLAYKEDRTPLVEKIKAVYANAEIKLPKLTLTTEFRDIDPFSVFSFFNKGITSENRIKILREIASLFEISSPVPETFDGIPLANNQTATFYLLADADDDDKRKQNFDTLWNVFSSAIALADRAEEKDLFIQSYDYAIRQDYVHWNLTMGLYWIRPNFFINLDTMNRSFITDMKHFPAEAVSELTPLLKHLPDAETYLRIREISAQVLWSGNYQYTTFPELSYTARTTAKKADWQPTDYDPGLTAKDWLELLSDETIGNTNTLTVLACLKEMGAGSCTALSEKYGRSINFYNTNMWNLGKNVLEKKNLPPVPRAEDDTTTNWMSVPFLMRKAKKEETGSWVFKLRDELSAALDEMDLSVIPLYAEEDSPKEDKPANPPQRYWWLAMNPEGKTLSEIEPGEIFTITVFNEEGNQRRNSGAYRDAKTGDIVVGCERQPNRQVTCICQIEKENDGKVVTFKKLKVLSSPISLTIFSNYPELSPLSQPNQNWVSLRALSEEQYNLLMELGGEGTSAAPSEAIEQTENPVSQKEPPAPYTREDFLADVFMSEEQLNELLGLLDFKQNIILQGAPGVGKTFAAKRLAHLKMGFKDDSRVESIQFHQNYSYEDFIMGYKPTEDGHFTLKTGIFYDFCERAKADPDRPHFFLIDEINRGNLSKIFGELLMLLEKDYRGPEHAVRLAYNNEMFSVPKNLYLIGMMNTADRSLALIDYALRRRFGFYDMAPGFETEQFKAYRHDIGSELFDALLGKVKELNAAIAADASLGKGFLIGHSHFCGLEGLSAENLAQKLRLVVKYDILPTLSEYWFDDEKKYNEWADALTEIVK